MKIKEPNWNCLLDMADSLTAAKGRLALWFSEEVEPINKLLSAGEVVYLDRHSSGWRRSEGDHTQATALLIKQEEIKPDSFVDVVRDYLGWESNPALACTELDRIKARMKKLLGDEK